MNEILEAKFRATGSLSHAEISLLLHVYNDHKHTLYQIGLLEPQDDEAQRIAARIAAIENGAPVLDFQGTA